MMTRKVFISTTTFGAEDQEVLKTLKKNKINIVLNPHRRRLNENEIKDVLVQGGYQGLLAGLEPLTPAVLSQAKQLKVISRVGVGLDNVNLEAAKSLGIKVYNTPGVLTDSVAELTLSLILAALRKITLSDRQMHAGVWEKHSGSLLKGKTVGIIGFGNIGQRVAQLVSVFGAKVIFSDVYKIKSKNVQVPLSHLLKKADIVSFHSSAGTCLIGSKEINSMKLGAILVNTARGALIDENALLKGLISKRVGFAALDVFNQEPYQGKLTQQNNVILTPHIGSYAREARILMEKAAVDNLIKGLQNV